MSAVRIVLILLILGGLALFTLQNMSPALPLVVLGGKTLALPLAVWVVGAIVAGACTTLILSGLIRLGRPASRRSATQRPSSRTSSRFGASTFQTPWNPGSRPRSAASGNASANASTRLQDDWEASSSAKEEWDDWEEPTESARSASTRPPQPEIRDRLDDEWANWDGYEEVFDREPSRSSNRRSSDPFDRPLDQPPEPPVQTDFEVKQEPTTRYQSGSVYSFSYQKSERFDSDRPDSFDPPANPPDSFEPPADRPPIDLPNRKPGVYDAEYRVLTPPYRPDPEPEPPVTEEEEEWGFEEENEAFERDRDSDQSREDDERDRRFRF